MASRVLGGIPYCFANCLLENLKVITGQLVFNAFEIVHHGG